MSSNKLNEARTLYESEIHKVQKTPEKWKDFLDFAAKARISKMQNEFEFSTKLIIHSINPKATDCRMFGEWKTQDGNHVNYGEHSITVLSRDSRGNQSVTYLFDTSQTALKKESELLDIPEEIKENLKSALSNMVEKYSNNASFSDEQKRIFKATAEYKLCKQYGLETNDNATVNDGKGGISEADRTDSNVTFDTVKISDYSNTPEERIAADNPPETKFTALSEEARTFYELYSLNTPINPPEKTPWGETQSCHELNKGIFRVSTPSHGGIMIRSDIADKILSPEARKIGFREKGFHCYEEDCDACVPERELLDKGIMQVPDYYTDGAEKYNEIINEELQEWHTDYWDKREQAIFNARPEEEQAAITGQMSLFGDIPDLEDFPDFTEEENISDNTVTKAVEKSDLSQTEKNAPVNDSSEVSVEKQEKKTTAKKEYFRITDEHLGEGSKREKFQNNIEAIRTLQLIENEDRPATPEEQETLSKYIGWGGLQEAFDENNSAWSKEYSELINLLSEKEY